MDKDKKDNRKLVLLLIASLSIIVLIFCVVKLVIYKLSSFNATDDIKKLEDKIIDSQENDSASKYIVPDSSFDNSDISDASHDLEILGKYTTLYGQNSDFSGWIKIDGTNISYPVMKNSTDAEYYLHRNFEKASSDEGLPFIDQRCSIIKPSKNIIIYGHNMKNGDMFADLLKYSDPEYYSMHSTVKFDSLYREGEYHIISVLCVDVSEKSDDFKFYEFTDETYDGEFSAYLRGLKEASLYPISFEASKISELITLSTCEYTKKDGRFVIVAAKYVDT